MKEDPDVVRESLDLAARAIARSLHVVAFLGSAPVPSHDPGQISKRAAAKLGPPPESYGKFLESPRGWWQRRIELSNGSAMTQPAASPSVVHHSLAAMEREGYLQNAVTDDTRGLLEEAGCRSVIEIHGSDAKLRCIQCGTMYVSGQISFDELPPRCPSCGGWIKIDALLPGEPRAAAALNAYRLETTLCDVMLLIETPGVAYPAASYPLAASHRGAWLIEINPAETALSAQCDFVVRASAEVALPALLEELHAVRSLAAVPQG